MKATTIAIRTTAAANRTTALIIDSSRVCSRAPAIVATPRAPDADLIRLAAVRSGSGWGIL